MSGRLIAIARRNQRRAPMEDADRASISMERGIEGDHKGAKFPLRQVTIIAIEAWRAAIEELVSTTDDPAAGTLPWTTRRANLLVEQVELPRAKGGLIAIGDVKLEVTAKTVPCRRMDEAFPGLQAALRPDWRGGITCRVIEGGNIAKGDPVEVLLSPPEHKIRLPG